MQDRFRLKFWDNTDKELGEVINIDFDNGFVDFKTKDGITSTQIKCGEILQCTGLKDKKGELVYFNDFIKLDDGIVCIVKQIEDINDIEYGRVVAIPVFCLGKKYQTQYIPTVIAEGEKVGNFYENPELLESEEK